MKGTIGTLETEAIRKYMVSFTEIFNTLFQNFSALLKVEGHSQKTFFFVNANMKLALSLATHRSFSVYSAARSPNVGIVAGVLNSG